MKYRPSKILLLVVLLPLLLATLATLQYRWLGQVSNGERERMQASLVVGTRQFSQDFNREITRAYLSFEIDAASLRNDKSRTLAERLRQWNENAPYPKLVREFFVFDKSEVGISQFSHFNRTWEKFERVEWNSECRRSWDRDCC